MSRLKPTSAGSGASAAKAAQALSGKRRGDRRITVERVAAARAVGNRRERTEDQQSIFCPLPPLRNSFIGTIFQLAARPGVA